MEKLAQQIGGQLGNPLKYFFINQGKFKVSNMTTFLLKYPLKRLSKE